MSLRDEILAGGFDLVQRDYGAIAAALSVGRTKIVSRLIGVGTILDALGPTEGAAVLDALEVIGTQVSAVKWGVRLLNASNLDIGLPSVRAQIDALVGVALTVEQAAALKALAIVPDPYSVGDISDELNRMASDGVI